MSDILSIFFAMVSATSPFLTLIFFLDQGPNISISWPLSIVFSVKRADEADDNPLLAAVSTSP